MEKVTNKDMDRITGQSMNDLPEGFTPLTSQVCRLDEGESVMGILKSIEETPQTPILHIETEGGEMAIWATAQVEETILEAHIGHRIFIKSLGKKELKGGRSLNAFQIAVQQIGKNPLPKAPTKEELESIRDAREVRKIAYEVAKKAGKKKVNKKKAKKKGGGK